MSAKVFLDKCNLGASPALDIAPHPRDIFTRRMFHGFVPDAPVNIVVVSVIIGHEQRDLIAHDVANARQWSFPNPSWEWIFSSKRY